MKLKFTKMHGLGNDFIVIDAINQSVSLDPATIRRWADRHFGIGFDQLLVVENPEKVGISVIASSMPMVEKWNNAVTVPAASPASYVTTI